VWQVLYERQGPIRKRALHAQIAARLEARFEARPAEHLVAELVDQFHAAQDWVKSLDYIRIALRTAAARFANRDSLVMLDRAKEIAAHLSQPERTFAEMEILERRAGTYSANHDAAAEECYEQVIALARRLGAVESEVRSLLGLAYAASWENPQRSLAILEEALDSSRRLEDSVNRKTAQLVIYVRQIWAGGWDRQKARDCELLLGEMKRQSGDEGSPLALINFSMICMVSSRYRMAHDTFKAGYAALFQSRDYLTSSYLNRAVWMYHVGVPWSCIFLGEFGRAQAEFEAGIGILSRNNDQAALSAFNTYSSLMFFFARDYRRAFALSSPVARGIISPGQHDQAPAPKVLPVAGRIALIFSGLSAIALGDLEQGLMFLTAAERRMTDKQAYLDWYWRPALQLGWVELKLAKGDLAAAREAAGKFIHLAEETDERTWQGLAWDSMARTRLRSADIAGAETALLQALSACEGFEAPLAKWTIHETAAAIYKGSGDTDKADAHAGEAIRIGKELAARLSATGEVRH